MAAYRDHRDGVWRYRVRVQLPDGRRVRITGTPAENSKVAAAQAEREAIAVAMQRPDVVHGRSPTVSQWLTTCIDRYSAGNRPSTINLKRWHLRDWIAPAIGDISIDAVKASHIERLRASINRSPSTINNVLRTLAWALRLAQEHEVIDRLPRVRLVPNPRTGLEWLRDGDVKKMKAARGLSPRERVALLLGLDAGLRVGEAGALQWGDIVDDKIHARRSCHKRIVGPTKAGRDRWVPMSEDLAASIVALRKVATDDLWVLPRASGGAADQDTLRPILRRVCALAGVRIIGYHVLRHTFCTRLAMAGVDIATIRELAGHADISTSARYMHVASEAGRRAIDKIR